MKFFKPTFLFILIISFCFSCRKAPEELNLKGEVQFELSALGSGPGRVADDVDPTKLIVTIQNEDGVDILVDEEIPLQKFNSNFISDPISLPVGVYDLTKFWVNIEDSVIYLTPLEDAELAYLVNEPLPITFEIASDQVSTVRPEVLSATEGEASDFGFGEFGFDVVQTFDLLLGVLVYDAEEQGYDFTTASISISNDEKTIIEEKELFANVNKLVLRDEEANYQVSIVKDGYETYEQEFTTDSLKNYLGIGVNGVLEITLTELDPTNGLVAYYPFDGDANDASDNTHDGVVIGALLTQDKDGNDNSAYAFDGSNDYIEIDNHSDFENQTYSISLWFNSANGAGALVSMSDLSPIRNNTGYYLSILDNKMRGLHNVISGVGGWVRNNDDDVLNLNEWYHVVQTYDGTELKLFINGEFTGSVTDSNAINYAERNPLLIGTYAFQDGGAFYFEGSIDEVRIYDRALAENEISNLFGL